MKGKDRILNNYRIAGLFIFTILFTSVGFISCDDAIEDDIQNETIMLTEDEQANLLFMREEEKLARDVYLYFNEKYELNFFNNISSSEQYHMDAVLEIMDKYGIEDQASKEMGIFTNNELQKLYDDLITQGNILLIDALKVGATIEDVDIRDLGNAIDNTSKTDIINMYEMLECGSRNHLRAFTDQLESRGEIYSPQFISQESYDGIIDGNHESCGR